MKVLKGISDEDLRETSKRGAMLTGNYANYSLPWMVGEDIRKITESIVEVPDPVVPPPAPRGSWFARWRRRRRKVFVQTARHRFWIRPSSVREIERDFLAIEIHRWFRPCRKIYSHESEDLGELTEYLTRLLMPEEP